jgi:hypothetical protein
MTGGDCLDLIRSFIERVYKADVSTAAQTERVRHFLADQVIADNLSPVSTRSPSPAIARPVWKTTRNYRRD